jgi:hypothetical protein
MKSSVGNSTESASIVIVNVAESESNVETELGKTLAGD